VAQFVYGSRDNVPDVVLRDGKIFRIIVDQLGSPRAAINVNNPNDAPFQVTYDPFGNLVSSTNPGWMPFGFAGGLYDPDTGLVRFGARDYQPGSGRWIEKDPIGFRGGSTNLYEYAHNDTINARDPSGRDIMPKGTPKECGEAGDKLLSIVDASKNWEEGILEEQQLCQMQCKAAGFRACYCEGQPSLVPLSLFLIDAFAPGNIGDFADHSVHDPGMPYSMDLLLKKECDPSDAFYVAPFCASADEPKQDPCSMTSTDQCECGSMSSVGCDVP